MRRVVHHRLVPREGPGLLSIVVPMYNEREVIPLLRAQLTELADQFTHGCEIIVINDGSCDDTLDLLLDWGEADPRVRVVGLARNFGHQAALTAGLDIANGDAIVVMDADLQDPPRVILDMLREYRRGYDVVYAQRSARAGEGLLKRFSAWAFYRAMRLLVHPDLPPDCGDFRLISRPCLDALTSMRETHRFLRGMVAWVGFAQTVVRFDRPARAAGKTKYPLRKMLAFAWTAALSFSAAPLRLSLAGGALLGFFGLADGVYAVGRHFLGYKNVAGWTSIIAVMCLIGGGILVSIGILGEYIGRIYEESKGRPLYLISLTANLPETRVVPSAATTLPKTKTWPLATRARIGSGA